jgi:hypothetical protein
MLKEVQTDILDNSYVGPAIKSLLSLLAPEYVVPSPFVFRVEPVLKGGTYKVTTNVDFGAANASYNQHVPQSHSTLTVAYLLSQIADTRRDLVVGSRFESEFAVAPVRALIGAHKFAEIMSAAGKGIQVADLFQETVIDDVPNIREVVNSGKRNFRDIAHLVRQAEQFREWLKKQGNAEDLRKAYCQDVAHLDWADKLPPKSLRWLMITAAGFGLSAVAGPIAGTIAATALSAGDAFLLDKLLKGWKPNHFIEGPLKQFLKDS